MCAAETGFPPHSWRGSNSGAYSANTLPAELSPGWVFSFPIPNATSWRGNAWERAVGKTRPAKLYPGHFAVTRTRMFSWLAQMKAAEAWWSSDKPAPLCELLKNCPQCRWARSRTQKQGDRLLRGWLHRVSITLCWVSVLSSRPVSKEWSLFPVLRGLASHMETESQRHVCMHAYRRVLLFQTHEKEKTSPDFSIPIRIVVYYFWIWIIAFPGLLNIAKSHLQWIGLAPLIESCCEALCCFPPSTAACFLKKERKYIFTTNATCRLKGNCCKIHEILNSYSTMLELSPKYPQALPISRKEVSSPQQCSL